MNHDPIRVLPSLTFAQRERLRRMLEEKRAQLLRAHDEREEEAAEQDVDSTELGDVAEGVLEDRARAALEEHDRAILAEVEHALDRVHEGTYGLSEATGRPIPFERLLAVPWARSDVPH